MRTQKQNKTFEKKNDEENLSFDMQVNKLITNPTKFKKIILYLVISVRRKESGISFAQILETIITK